VLSSFLDTKQDSPTFCFLTPKTKYKIFDLVKFLKTSISKNIIVFIMEVMTLNLNLNDKKINNKIDKGVGII
jgi:hypothetical protein